MRTLFALLVLLTLPACSRDAGAPLIDSRTPPALGPRFFQPDGWAWGVLSQPGAPRIRYGAVAPSGLPRADVVILPTYGENAEVYYETAHDLTEHGYAVWVLEAAGQGGSERFPGQTDVGRSNGFGVDAAALQGLVARVVRPRADRPVIVAASGASAVIALLAAEQGLKPASGLFLWDPVLTPPIDVERAKQMTHWRLGGLRADGGKPWTRPTQDLSGRSTLPAAWQLADPDLRMGGPAWEWIAAADEARREALDPARIRRIDLPLGIEQGFDSDSVKALCAGAPHCQLASAPRSPQPRHLAPDAIRAAWLKDLTDFVEARIAEHAHAT